MTKAQEIVKLIDKHDKIAVFHHKGIDGDSLSSSYGLILAMRKKYPNKEIVWVANSLEIKQSFPWFKIEKKLIKETIDESYLAIIGDTSSENKVNSYDQLLNAGKVICFDHHRNDINIHADIFWSEKEYPASCIQAIQIAKEMGVEFDEEIAFYLSIGILTDTGFFRYSLANPLPVKIYSEMLEYISNEKMDWFLNSTNERTERDLEVVKFFYDQIKYDGKVAYVYFDKESIASFSDINFKEKIHSIGNIKGYSIWAVFVEDHSTEVPTLKLHFRSNGPNVAKVAIAHNGGGHIRAAGAKIKLEKNTLKNILKELNSL